MKRTKQCPKCESRKIALILRAPGQVNCDEQYFCSDCGYLEEYYESDYLKQEEPDKFRWINEASPSSGVYR